MSNKKRNENYSSIESEWIISAVLSRKDKLLDNSKIRSAEANRKRTKEWGSLALDFGYHFYRETTPDALKVHWRYRKSAALKDESKVRRLVNCINIKVYVIYLYTVKYLFVMNCYSQ